MTQQNELYQILLSKPLRKRALQGAGIALVLAGTFLFGVLSLGLWAGALLPLSTASMGGAMGGIYYGFMDDLREQGGLEKAFANVSSVLVYAVLLWISLVPGLALIGLWN